MSRRVPTATELYFPQAPHDPVTLERLEHDFFGTIRLSNGTYKYTYARRLDDLNEAVAGLLPRVRPLRVMDVAVSSGVSTLEWSLALERLGVAHTMTAGDLHLTAYLVTLSQWRKVLVDEQGYPLQYEILGRAVLNVPAKKLLPLVWPAITLCRLGLSRAFPQMRRVAGTEHGDAREAGKGISIRTVKLVSPRIHGSPRIRLITDDISHNSALRDSFHVLRAANVLNRDYFDEPALRQIVLNLRARLVEGGVLVICSTTGDIYRGDPKARSNDGTVFVARPHGGLDVIGRIGRGSAVESLVLELTGGPTSSAVAPAKAP